jgi:hypothetical protein
MKVKKRIPAIGQIAEINKLNTNRTIYCNNINVKPFLKKDELLKLSKEVQS